MAKKLDLSSLTEQERFEAALDRAAKQLSYRALSEKALYDKLLEKGFGERESAAAIAYLVERGFLSDERLAESAVRSYGRRGYGSMRIRQELRRHGIGDEDTDAALEQYEADPEVLHKLLDKRLHGDVSDRKEVEKAVAALQRRGYRWDEIRRALDSYGGSIEDPDEL